MAKRFMKYNPAFLTEEELIQSFIARQIDFNLILQIIRNNVVGSNQHVLVIGPRGSGKTTLILRIAAAVRNDPELANKWHPIIFAEESYEVSSAGEFWLAALSYLSDQTGEESLTRSYEEIKEEKDDKRLRERALSQLMDFSDQQGKRFLILVENFNMLFDQGQISEREAWDLRHVLLNEKRIMMLATATSRFESIENGDQAFFELFKIHELKPLNADECQAVWKKITGHDLADDRIRPIQILTGGNPRLLMIISTFGANLSFKDLMDELIHLVDDHTEYFKSHLDNLPAIERKVYLALSEIWDPATARTVAQAARLDVNKTSSLLNRLAGRGAVTAVTEGKRIKRYQVVERIYNIYHLMRRQGGSSSRVKAIVNFMVTFYGQEDLITLTQRIIEEACLLDPDLCQDHYVLYDTILQKVNSREIREKIILSTPQSFLESPNAPLLKDLMKNKISTHYPFFEKSQKEKKRGKDQIPTVQIKTKSEKEIHQLLKKARYLSEQPDKLRESEQVYRKALELNPENSESWLGLGTLLQKNKARFKEAEQAFRKAIETNQKNVWAWIELGELLQKNKKYYEEAEAAYRKALEIDPNYDWAWAHLGQLLHEKIGRYEEAEAAYRKALEIDPNYKWAWAQLGQLLHEKIGRYEEAETAYRKALEIDPNYKWAWVQLGQLLHQKIGRYEEAEAAYRKALEIDPNYDWAWAHLGQLLHQKMDRYEEAEAAYRKALEIDPNYKWAWTQLGQLLHQKIGRYEEAEAAYRKALEIDPNYDWAWAHLGQLLHQKMDRYEEAEAAYRKALEIDPNYKWAWTQLGQLLHQKMGRYEEAEAAYRKALEIDPNYKWAWAQLGQLLHERMDRYEEAEAAYRKVIEIQPSVSLGWELLGKVLSQSEKYNEAHKAFKKALELNPKSISIRIDLIALLLDKLNQPIEALKLSTDFLKTQNENPAPYNSFAWTFYKYGGKSLLDQAEEWAREAVSLGPDNPSYHHTLACVLALKNRAQEALEPAQKYLDKTESLDRTVSDVIELFVSLAAAGCVRDALKMLENSRFTNALEPLLIGLKLYNGEDVKVAVEIMEVAKDVAKRIKERQQKLLNDR